MNSILLADGEATSFLCQKPGQWQILVDLHGGNTLTLQVARSLTGTWVDTDVTFTDVGVKRFGMAHGFYYRLSASDLTGASAVIGFESASHG